MVSVYGIMELFVVPNKQGQKSRLRRRGEQGFTLIELLVVVSIIALLVAILLPALNKARGQAKAAVCGVHLKQIGMAMLMYSDAYNEAIPPDHDEMHGYAVYRDSLRYPTGELRPLRWAYLFELDYIDTPEIFYCPANRQTVYRYESYTNPTPWGTLPQFSNTEEGGGNGNQWVRIGYTYFPLKRGARSGLDEAEKYSKLDKHMPYATDILHGLHNLSHQHNEVYEVNALYPDGHVSRCNNQMVFEDPIWEGWPDYETYYYTVFHLIGRQ